MIKLLKQPVLTDYFNLDVSFSDGFALALN